MSARSLWIAGVVLLGCRAPEPPSAQTSLPPTAGQEEPPGQKDPQEAPSSQEEPGPAQAGCHIAGAKVVLVAEGISGQDADVLEQHTLAKELGFELLLPRY